MPSTMLGTGSPARGRDIASALVHLSIFSVSLLASFGLAYDFSGSQGWFFGQFMLALPLFLFTKYVVFSLLRQHQRSWRYVGMYDVASVVLACLVASAVLLGLIRLLVTSSADTRFETAFRFPVSVVLLDGILTLVLVVCFRAAIRGYFELGRFAAAGGPRTLIIGAGDAGETLLREIQRMPDGRYDIVGFLDDDHRKAGTRIHGVEVLGAIDTVKLHCNVRRIEQILIAIPSAPRRRIREIIALCEGAGIQFRIVPGLSELIEGTITIESQLRRVQVEDLLQRKPVVLDRTAISAYLHHRRVLVTGAGGSIGSELCRQILQFQPASLALVELCENNLFEIQRELSADTRNAGRLTGYLADICDRSRMAAIFAAHRPDIVCHAAAHKHVPMLEAHPGEGVKNNILGTRTIADLAVAAGVEKFVYISTDKAVNPTSIMGCTKRIAEMYVQGLSDRGPTRFITVRFGNVLSSRGSVVPIFQEQIARGGPLTVTHPDMTRYFMTIPEAAQLVLQAGSIGQGGEIFLLEMGEPVKIVDLARNLITLSGLTPGVDIDIQFTGLRPGEKLYEELYIDGEGLTHTSHPNIRVWRRREEDWERLREAIPDLLAMADTASLPDFKRALAVLVPEYQVNYSLSCAATVGEQPIIKV